MVEKWKIYLGYAGLFGLLILSAFFYQERILFVDTAYQTFLMVKDGYFQVMVNRFGAVLVQWLPLIGIKMEWPLRWVIFLYSLSFPLLFLFWYHLTVKWLKQPAIGLCIVLLFTLMVRDAFYWVPSELQQGLAFLLFWTAFVVQFFPFSRWWQWLIAFIGVICIAYYHPLTVIPFFFLWIFFWLSRPSFRRPVYYGLAGFMVVMQLFKQKFSSNWYDNAKYAEFFNNLEHFFPHYWNIPSNLYFLQAGFQQWYGLWLVLIVVLIFYLVKKDWWKIGLIVSFFTGYVLLVNLMDPHWPYLFYAEVNYLPLSIMVCIPLLVDVLPSLKHKTLPLALLSVFIAIRLITIGAHHKEYSSRLEWLDTQLQAGMPHKKLWTEKEKAPNDLLKIDWGTPYETLVMSSLKSKDAGQTLYLLPTSADSGIVNTDSLFLGLRHFPIDAVESNYFSLDKSFYKKLVK